MKIEADRKTLDGTDDPDLLVGIAGKLTPVGHVMKARVYVADTDFTGIVYHARYLDFFERGRSDFLRLMNIHHVGLAAGEYGETMIWVVRRMTLSFCQPARIDDILTITTSTEEMSGARMKVDQKLMRASDLLVEAKVEVALVGPGGKPRRFPKEWVASFCSLLDHEPA